MYWPALRPGQTVRARWLAFVRTVANFCQSWHKSTNPAISQKVHWSCSWTSATGMNAVLFRTSVSTVCKTVFRCLSFFTCVQSRFNRRFIWHHFTKSSPNGATGRDRCPSLEQKSRRTEPELWWLGSAVPRSPEGIPASRWVDSFAGLACYLGVLPLQRIVFAHKILNAQ